MTGSHSTREASQGQPGKRRRWRTGKEEVVEVFRGNSNREGNGFSYRVPLRQMVQAHH